MAAPRPADRLCGTVDGSQDASGERLRPGLARQLGVSWLAVWRAVKPILQARDQDPAQFEGVATLGVDEHLWHHVSTKSPDQGVRI